MEGTMDMEKNHTWRYFRFKIKIHLDFQMAKTLLLLKFSFCNIKDSEILEVKLARCLIKIQPDGMKC